MKVIGILSFISGLAINYAQLLCDYPVWFGDTDCYNTNIDEDTTVHCRGYNACGYSTITATTIDCIGDRACGSWGDLTSSGDINC